MMLLTGRTVRFVAVLVTLVLAGCGTPTGHLLEYADRSGYSYESIQADGFEHLVVKNYPFSDTDILHIYLEGDGSPWRYRHVIMPDPTPRSPLMLKLMRLDKSPSAYVGRPCYNGTHDDAGCNNRLWTSARYSSTVVSSMSSTIHALIDRHKVKQVRLFGHSGGGALSMLLAARLEGVTDVVTIAGNLDITAWTDHHRYTPLYSSLNPATQPPLDTSILQWHLVGSKDSVVPPEIVRPFIQSQSSAYGIAISNYSHSCCWGRVWNDVLFAVKFGKPGRLPGIRFKHPKGDRNVSVQ